MLFGRELRLPSCKKCIYIYISTVIYICVFLFGRPQDTPSSREEYIRDLQEWFDYIHNFVRERTRVTIEQMNIRYDMKAIRHEVNEGNKVWLWNPVCRKEDWFKIEMTLLPRPYIGSKSLVRLAVQDVSKVKCVGEFKLHLSNSRLVFLPVRFIFTFKGCEDESILGH